VPVGLLRPHAAMRRRSSSDGRDTLAEGGQQTHVPMAVLDPDGGVQLAVQLEEGSSHGPSDRAKAGQQAAP
jgi:hypothetical protein